MTHQPGLDSYSEAINSFEHALVFDPHSTEAQSWLANALVGRVLDLHPGSSWSDLKRADTLVSQARAASPRNPLAHFVKGQLLRVEGRCDEKEPAPSYRYPVKGLSAEKLGRVALTPGECLPHADTR